MSEHPIIFSGAMVRAILEGRKTQTRRVVKPQPVHPKDDAGFDPVNLEWRWDWENVRTCPYGVPGDRLWVRECFTRDGVDERAAVELGRAPVHYRADGEPPEYLHVRWRPSIHMPRWASRITLGVAEVRVQRVREISEGDAEAEGIDGNDALVGQISNPYRTAYADLWDSINAKRGFPWSANPWVWAITFSADGGDLLRAKKDASV